MPMNPIHRLACRSRWWRGVTTTKVIPWTLRGAELGDNVLEIGPGYGANFAALRERTTSLTGVEIDGALVDRLQRRFGDVATVIRGDGAAMPFPDDEFSSVVCFTMLHHVPSAERQDALFSEAFRVLRPGGVFAGSDSTGSTVFSLLHVGDTCVTVDPATLPVRLGAAGFVDVQVSTARRHVRFRGRKPGSLAAAS